MLPRIKLTDLLIDVAYITRFHEQFTNASNNRKPDKEETIIIMAALLGMGMNIGLSKMAEATPGLTYKQLANASQWRMYEDDMNVLARDIFFGKQGELRERTIQHQLQRANALNIIINAISIWNTLHLKKAVEYQKRADSFNEELLHHTSPLGWEHINLLEEYHLNSKK